MQSTMLRQQPWSLWWIQARRLTRIEIRRNLFTRRAWWIYFLAFIPAVIILIHLLIDSHSGPGMSDDTMVLAGVVQLYYVRLGIFFGCLGIFSRLIRGEMIERSLHYYLLSPVRREVILLSKFFAGAVSAVVLFGAAMIADFVLMYAGYGAAGRDFMLHGPGLGQLEAYLLIVVLGMPRIRRDFSAAQPDVSQSHAGCDVAAGVGGDQSGVAFAAAEVQCRLVPSSPDASERTRGGHICAAHGGD